MYCHYSLLSVKIIGPCIFLLAIQQVLAEDNQINSIYSSVNDITSISKNLKIKFKINLFLSKFKESGGNSPCPVCPVCPPCSLDRIKCNTQRQLDSKSEPSSKVCQQCPEQKPCPSEELYLKAKMPSYLPFQTMPPFMTPHSTVCPPHMCPPCPYQEPCVKPSCPVCPNTINIPPRQKPCPPISKCPDIPIKTDCVCAQPPNTTPCPVVNCPETAATLTTTNVDSVPQKPNNCPQPTTCPPAKCSTIVSLDQLNCPPKRVCIGWEVPGGKSQPDFK